MTPQNTNICDLHLRYVHWMIHLSLFKPKVHKVYGNSIGIANLIGWIILPIWGECFAKSAKRRVDVPFMSMNDLKI